MRIIFVRHAESDHAHDDLPFPYVMHVMQHDPASIIILEFPVDNGTYVYPRIELFNDCSGYRT